MAGVISPASASLGLLVLAALCLAQPARAQNVACNVRCAKEILSKPDSFAASLLVSEAMMARSVTKYCPGTRIVASRKPTYDLFLANARKVFGLVGAGKIRRHSDRRARESIELYGGCAGMKKIFNAKFAAWLLGWK